jgi:hypothetical protein
LRDEEVLEAERTTKARGEVLTVAVGGRNPDGNFVISGAGLGVRV